MTCRHMPGDPSCSSSRSYQEPAKPDSENYHVEDVQTVGTHLVMKVRYPNCSRCSYEGVKVMVWLDVSLIDAIRWRKIDPHFRDPKKSRLPTEAPGPSARFPASPEGWRDAILYANAKGSHVR